MAHENAPLSNKNSLPNFQEPIEIRVNQRNFDSWVAQMELPHLPILQESIPITDNEQKFRAWVTRMESKERGNAKRIPRVPTYLRDKEYYKKCFDPVVVSLGPYHHGKPHLQFMEKYKFNAMKRFTDDDFFRAAFYNDELGEVILEAKQWYEEPIDMSDEEFKIMMFVDGCFILTFVRDFGYEYSKNKKPASSIDYDQLLVLKDIMMLENQIPFPVLKNLMYFKHSLESNRVRIFGNFVSGLTGRDSNYDWEKNENPFESIHLLDLSRKAILGRKKEINKPHDKAHELDTSFSCPTVTQLKHAGIRCQTSPSPYQNEIYFKESRVLSLPRIMIGELSKYVFVNMIAYEMIPGGPPDHGIISYVCFMDALIDREEDVNELGDRGILGNGLDTDKEVVDFFNGLKTDLVLDQDAYADVRRAVEQHLRRRSVKCMAYCKPKCMSFMLEFYQTHLKSPWKVIGLCAAAVLFFLQGIQTYFTVYPRHEK